MNERTGGFTHGELVMLSNGILFMMENTSKAMDLIKSSEAHDILSKELDRYCQLNNKVCDMMTEPGKEGETDGKQTQS